MPIDQNDFKETDDKYIFWSGCDRIIQKNGVKSIRYYDLCEFCGFEIKENLCSNFACNK